MLDLVIKGGSVVDGTGRERFRADVGVRDGRIVAIGDITEQAAKTIDAEGRVVTPGFVDLHTHYDPQVMWDPAATPSSLHGVTSVFGGNCGFSIAPVTPEAAEYLIPMLARVEGMPVESLEAGLDLMWDGFGSWLNRLEGNLAVNAGFMVGHSALRRVVMGEDAVGHEATPEQIAAMVALLHRSIEEGGMGFSSTASNTHSDHQGNPVPSRWATRDEFLALSTAAGQHAGTSLEFIASAGAFFNDEEMNLMADMSVAAQRSLNWNVMVVSSDPAASEGRANKLSASDVAAAKGGHVVGLCLPEPMRMRLCFASGFVLDILPGVKDVIHLPLPERNVCWFADKAKRSICDHGVANLGHHENCFKRRSCRRTDSDAVHAHLWVEVSCEVTSEVRERGLGDAVLREATSCGATSHRGDVHHATVILDELGDACLRECKCSRHVEVERVFE